jgi:hypothetical protein
MRRLGIVLLLLTVGVTAFGADFRGFSLGNYLQYRPDVHASYIEPIAMPFSVNIGGLFDSDVKRFSDQNDFKKLLKAASQIAEEKGCANYAFSYFDYYPGQNSYITTDLLLW